jgi:hypothetical protein
MVMVLEQAFVDAEIKLALYYSSIRDKIGALNVAVVGFSFTVFERVSDIKTEFFFFLIALGVFFLLVLCGPVFPIIIIFEITKSI